MRRISILALAIALLAVGGRALAARSEAEPANPSVPPADPLAPLAWLAGSCWTGTFADGKTEDFVCYEWVFGGKHLRSRHHVEGGPQPYSGETFYSYDRKAQTIRYVYFNSDGDVLSGDAVPSADGVTFPSEQVTIAGQSTKIRTTWRRKGPDAYAAVTERLFGEEWRTLFTIEFARDRAAAPGSAASRGRGD